MSGKTVASQTVAGVNGTPLPPADHAANLQPARRSPEEYLVTPATASADAYHSVWNPSEYLKQYYSLPQLAEDDAHLMRTLTGWLRDTNRLYPTAIDIGCGPTIHNTFAIAPYVETIDLADYLPSNLAEARKWLDNDPAAHHWDALFQGVLNCGGGGDLEMMKNLYRARLRQLLHCDLKRSQPLDTPTQYDLVTSFFCVECITPDKEEWKQMMSRLFSLVKPGGSVFLAVVRNASQYAVLGQWIPAVPIIESDLESVLQENGFVQESIQIDTFWAPDWEEDGFDRICVARAHRE